MDIEKINVGGTQYDVCDTVARAAVSDEFSTGATYAAGDYCIYENTLYKFTAAKEPGAWDASKVAATQIGDELSQLNGKIDWKLYKGTNCTVYYADNVGMGVRVIASGLTLQPGSVNSNVVATLPSQAAFFGSLVLPCSLMSSDWVSVSQNCTLSFSNATKEIRARISGNVSVSDAVINGFFFFPPALAYAG